MAAGKNINKKHPRKPSQSKRKRIKKPSKYDEKIVVNASFEELMKELVPPEKNHTTAKAVNINK